MRLAEDLLVISRADQGTLPVRAAPVSLAEIVVRVRTASGDRRPAPGARSSSTCPPRSASSLTRCGSNRRWGTSSINALRYGEGGVRVWARERDGRVEVHIMDEGQGFAPEFLDRAFDRFSRADEGRVRGGTGLGLAVVQGIASAHGGGAGARNRAAGGADVWLTLPRHPGRLRGDAMAGQVSGAGR